MARKTVPAGRAKPAATRSPARRRSAAKPPVREPRGRAESHRALLLGMVNHIARLGAGPLDLEHYLARVAEEIRSVFGYYWVGIFVGNYDRKCLELRSFSCDDPVSVKVGDTMDFGKGLVGATFQLGLSVRIDDVTRDSRYEEWLPGVRSELVVPILVGEFSLGVIDVQSRKKGAFDDDDVLVLDTLSYLIGAMVRAAQR